MRVSPAIADLRRAQQLCRPGERGPAGPAGPKGDPGQSPAPEAIRRIIKDELASYLDTFVKVHAMILEQQRLEHEKSMLSRELLHLNLAGHKPDSPKSLPLVERIGKISEQQGPLANEIRAARDRLHPCT